MSFLFIAYPSTLQHFTFKEVFLSSSHSHPRVISHFPSSWLKSILVQWDTPSDTPLLQRYTEEIKENNISQAALRTLVKADIQHLLIFYVYRYPWWQIAYYDLWLTGNWEQELGKNPGSLSGAAPADISHYALADCPQGKENRKENNFVWVWTPAKSGDGSGFFQSLMQWAGFGIATGGNSSTSSRTRTHQKRGWEFIK